MKNKKTYGYTLIELMVSMSISLIVLTSAIVLFSVNSSFGSQHIQKDFLRSQLNVLVTTMSDEIARAGFCYDCTSANPFILSETGNIHTSAILLDDSPTQANGTCIRFAYNHDKRQNTATINKDDAKGYRLGSSPSGNRVIEIYENRNGLTNWHCNSDSGVASGYWSDVTNSPLVIEDLTFERENFLAQNNGNVLQNVILTITASLTTDTSIRDSVSVTIYVQNVDG